MEVISGMIADQMMPPRPTCGQEKVGKRPEYMGADSGEASRSISAETQVEYGQST